MFTIPKKTIILINQGVYPAVIKSMEKAVGNYGEQIKFTFDLGDDCKLLAWTSVNYSEKSKLFKWCQSVLGDTFDPKDDFQSSWLLNKQVLIEVSRRLDKDGGEFNRVENVMGMPKQHTQSTATQPPEPWPDNN